MSSQRSSGIQMSPLSSPTGEAANNLPSPLPEVWSQFKFALLNLHPAVIYVGVFARTLQLRLCSPLILILFHETVDLYYVRKCRRRAINLPRERLNSRCENDAKYKARRIGTRRTHENRRKHMCVCVHVRFQFWRVKAPAYVRASVCKTCLALYNWISGKKGFICPGVTPDGCPS